MPILLIAAGLADRVIVTQPRRLPCREVCRRVSSIYGDRIAGYEMAGASSNLDAPIVFVTDGLLRARLSRANATLDCDVVVLDELHERGVQSDLCLALLARRMAASSADSVSPITFRLVLSSATLDPAVMSLFEDGGSASSLSVAKFSAVVDKPFAVDDIDLHGHHPVAVVAQCVREKKREDQVLCFLPSSRDVRNAVEMCEKHHNIRALALTAGSSVTSDDLHNASVFFSTTVAETSLTFPRLAFVVDSGRIVAPEFSNSERVTRLSSILAPQSTLDQRKGRLG